MTGHCQLNPAIIHPPYVTGRGRIAGRGREKNRIQQIRGELIVVIGGDFKPLVKESEIQTDVPLGRCLPFQRLGVGGARCIIGVIAAACSRFSGIQKNLGGIRINSG